MEYLFNPACHCLKVNARFPISRSPPVSINAVCNTSGFRARFAAWVSGIGEAEERAARRRRDGDAVGAVGIGGDGITTRCPSRRCRQVAALLQGVYARVRPGNNDAVADLGDAQVGRGSHDLNVKGLLLGPHDGSRVVSGHLGLDRVKVRRGVGLDDQVEGPEIRAGGRASHHEEVGGGAGEVAGPSRVRGAGQVVAAVAHATSAEVVDVQPVLAAVTVGHVPLNNSGLAGFDLEDFEQSFAEICGGLKVDDGHAGLGRGVAFRAIDVKGGGGAAAQREHRRERHRGRDGVSGGLGTGMYISHKSLRFFSTSIFVRAIIGIGHEWS